MKLKNTNWIFIGLILLTHLVATNEAHSAYLELHELTCLQAQDGPLRGNEDEIYLLVSISRADGSSQFIRIPGNGHWSMNSRNLNQVLRQKLFQEPIFPFQHTIVTLTTMESDNDPFAYGIQRAADIAASLAFQMRMAYVPYLANSIFDRMDLNFVLNDLRIRTHRFDDDAVIGQWMVELWHDGNQLRTRVVAGESTVPTLLAPLNAVLDLSGQGGRYLMSTQVYPNY